MGEQLVERYKVKIPFYVVLACPLLYDTRSSSLKAVWIGNSPSIQMNVRGGVIHVDLAAVTDKLLRKKQTRYG